MIPNDYPEPVIDLVMAEVRRHKEEIAAEFNYDVFALGRHLQSLEAGDPRVMTPAEFLAKNERLQPTP